MKKLFNAGPLSFVSTFVLLLALALAPMACSGGDAPAAATAAPAATPAAASAPAAAREPLPITLPPPTSKGTPTDLPTATTLEPVSKIDPPPFMAPKGVKNVALGKPVTSSVAPFTGELSQITDGKKDPDDSDAVEFKKGTQWIQVDLGADYEIAAIAMWHDHRYVLVFSDVIVQVSDDPEFKTGVTTLFNNDLDNSSGLGVGTEREYFETHRGKIVDGKGVKARYVRCYTSGSKGTNGAMVTGASALNCWQELEVYGLPAK